MKWSWNYLKYIGLAVLGVIAVIFMSRKPTWLRVKEDEIEKDKKKAKIKKKDVKEAEKEVKKEEAELEKKAKEYAELVKKNNRKIKEAKDSVQEKQDVTDPYRAVDVIANALSEHDNGTKD